MKSDTITILPIHQWPIKSGAEKFVVGQFSVKLAFEEYLKWNGISFSSVDVGFDSEGVYAVIHTPSREQKKFVFLDKESKLDLDLKE